MKKGIIIFILVIFYSQILFCQKRDSIQFLELGIGGGTPIMRSAFNLGLSVSMSNYVASFFEYNLLFNNSNSLYHEINYKIGPYFKIYNNSYFAVSTGASIIFNLKNSSNNLFFLNDTYDNVIMCLPIQMKLNFGVYKKIYFGIKVTYNKILYGKKENDQGTLITYLAYNF